MRRPARFGGWLTRPRLWAACGIAGPALFTAAWVVASLRQTGHAATEVQLSGLAAVDARDPQIMIGGFIGLGACSLAFGAALGQLAGSRAVSCPGSRAGSRAGSGAGSRAGSCAGSRAVSRAGSRAGCRARPRAGPKAAGPWLVKCAGAAAIAAGLFRRDHVLLVGPGFAGESWHNQVHDVVSGIAYAAMIAAPLVLARDFRGDPDWAAVSRAMQVLALISAVALVLFASRAVEPWNGTVQRLAVTLPLAAEMLAAVRMLGLCRDSPPACHDPL